MYRQPPVRVHPRILLGAGHMLTPAFAARHKITHVINCAFPEDSPLWFRKKFPDQYACMGALDSVHVRILDWYPRFESTMRKFLRESNGTIFVHCQAGINRSAYLLLFFMTVNFNQDFGKLVREVRKYRTVCTNPSFMKEVVTVLAVG
jgi:protein-tyrosine phosphatase